MSDPRDTQRPPHLEVVPPPDDNEPAGMPPPHDYAAERRALGACLHNPTALPAVTAIVQPADLWSPAHQTIYTAILDLYARTKPVDTTTVAHHLGKQLTKAGGPAYLEQLAIEGIGAVDPGYHAQIVADHAGRRRLIEHHQRGLQHAYQASPDTTTLQLLERTRTDLDKVTLGVPGIDTKSSSTYAAVDLEDALADLESGTYTGPKATRLHIRGGGSLLYPQAVHSISGEPGSAKTWVGLIACVQEFEANRPAAFIDFEDDVRPVLARLIALGATPDHIRQYFRYIRPQNSFAAGDTTALDQDINGCDVVIIDGITEAMTINGLSPNDNDDVANWLHLLPNRIAHQGPGVLQVDHVVKNAEARGRYAIGAQHKLAGITGVAYKAVIVRPFAKGMKGHTKLVIDKDKHGDVGPVGHTAAELHVDATDPSGAVYAWLDTPLVSTDEDGHFRPTILMQRVSDFLLATPGASSLNTIKAGVKGKGESIAEAVDALVREGNIRIETGPRGTQLHYLTQAFGTDQ